MSISALQAPSTINYHNLGQKSIWNAKKREVNPADVFGLNFSVYILGLAAADYEKRRQKEPTLLDRVRTYYKENTLD